MKLHLWPWHSTNFFIVIIHVILNALEMFLKVKHS